MAIDPRSEKCVQTLNPKVQVLARRLIEEATAQGIHVKIICGSRTRAEQDAIYAQGRTKPGPIVTKAKGGTSRINSGLPLMWEFLVPTAKNTSMNPTITRR